MSVEKVITAYPSLASKVWRRMRDISWRLSETRDAFFGGEFARLYNVVRPYTMSSNARLRALHYAVRHVVKNNIAGDVVECGTASGGSAALMGLALKQTGSGRTLWVFDTFEGLPPPTHDDPDFDVAKNFTGTCRGELSDVENLFRQLSILERARLVKGLFQETLPTCDVGNIAVLHLDGDWYDSVKTCLDNLYDKVSPGGVIQIDDYGHWAGARKAVDQFLLRRRIAADLRYIDYTGRQFIKTA